MASVGSAGTPAQSRAKSSFDFITLSPFTSAGEVVFICCSDIVGGSATQGHSLEAGALRPMPASQPCPARLSLLPDPLRALKTFLVSSWARETDELRAHTGEGRPLRTLTVSARPPAQTKDPSPPL